MENCLSIDYPKDKLKIYWITDGSTDSTNENLKKYPEATVLFQPERRGKTAAINRGMKSVTTPVVVFTDANTLINKEAVKEIVKAFADPWTGCVPGEKRIAYCKNAYAMESTPLNTALLLMQVTPVWLYQLFAVGQILFYMIALLGWYLAHRSLQSKLLFIPYYFLFMNLNVFKGMGYLKNFKGSAVWEKAERR